MIGTNLKLLYNRRLLANYQRVGWNMLTVMFFHYAPNCTIDIIMPKIMPKLAHYAQTMPIISGRSKVNNVHCTGK